MTAKTLEEEAREAALEHGKYLPADHDETNYEAFCEGFVEGSRAASTLRDKEIEELRARVKELEEVVEEYKLGYQGFP